MKLRIFLAGLITITPMISEGATNGEMIGFVTTNSGKVYQNCRIFKLDPDGVFFAHSFGCAKVLYNDMPDAVKHQLGYDSVKAADYSAGIIAKQKKLKERQFELQKEAVKARAFAQEIAMQSGAMQPAYPQASYVPPLSEWVGTVSSGGWSTNNFYDGAYSNGRNANWSPINDCLPYNSRAKIDHRDSTAYHFESRPKSLHNQNGNAIYRPDALGVSQCAPYSMAALGYGSRARFQPFQYGSNRFYNGSNYTNLGAAYRNVPFGFAGRSTCNNFVRPYGFFAVPALRTATPPLSVRPPVRSCAIARPVVSHH